jgi:hypothetical protein
MNNHLKIFPVFMQHLLEKILGLQIAMDCGMFLTVFHEQKVDTKSDKYRETVLKYLGSSINGK